MDIDQDRDEKLVKSPITRFSSGWIWADSQESYRCARLTKTYINKHNTKNFVDAQQ